MTVLIAPAAQRALDKIRRRDPPAARTLTRLINTLAEDPRPRGAKRMGGGSRACRLAAGDLRVVYLPQPRTVVAVGWRRDVYGRCHSN
ncbi:type II toxin-antitoxin system RelE family toxin [Streptomyces erythrochromogenes]|uniref:type II toxin-antitoxin system RelE family toxin n=1 Tax=Streptomyces erythrochromogenes TaxID=285574 RepID=UPI003702DE54